MTKKDLNDRCPLQGECERKCAYKFRELECDYYANNGVGEDRTIPDQEERRSEAERKALDEEYEADLADDETDDEDNSNDKATSADFGNIVMLHVDQLHPHQDNPRKDMGDITELAESIKARGILQNLTVVPNMVIGEITGDTWQRGYKVIAGHRRLAAAKRAGLKMLPCIVTNMTPEEQIAAMLVENVQRSDLTVYEQAKTFQQLTMDFGKSAQEISAISGFSEATVRRRQRLAELDEKKFKEACHRGATLFDFAELEKVEDPAAKERCLDAIGTQNFKNVLRSVLDQQKTKKKMEHWIRQLETFAVKIEKRDYVDGEYFSMQYVRNYGSWTKDDDVAIPSDSGTIQYFFTVSDVQISLYREDVADPEKDAEQKARDEIRRKDEARWARAQEITKRHKALRREFVMQYNAAKSHAQIIMRGCVDGMIFEAERNYYSDFDVEDYCQLLQIPYDENWNCPNQSAFKQRKAEQPEQVLLLTAYWYMDKCGGYAKHEWNTEQRRYEVVHLSNEKLDALYNFLEKLGYERSDEERQMSQGMHEVFGMDEVDEDSPCLLCKAAHPGCDSCCKNCNDHCNARQTCRREH